MQVLPSLDIQAGRSRLVWWPGASTGTGTPTDRPDAIAEVLAGHGAPVIHLVDLDGARQGQPANLGVIGAVARAVAKPLQVAGGIDGPEQIEIAFAAGATRVVVPSWAIVEDHARLAQCLRVAGDWLAVGLDARPQSLRDYPWRHRSAPALDEVVTELNAAGVRRFIFSHVSTSSERSTVSALATSIDAEVIVAGGVIDLDGVIALREAGVSGVILGEALFNGSIDLGEAITAAAGESASAGSTSAGSTSGSDRR